MRVLNYGVTRGRLRDRLEEGEGWDVINGLIRGGEDLVLVAELVGHARLETLRLYSQLTEADKQKRAAWAFRSRRRYWW